MDEIHYYKKWQTLLKNISDDYPGLHVVYTGSSMLQLGKSEGDLSRRLTMYEMRGLSLREFLEYEGIMQMPSVTLEQLLSEHVSIAMEVSEKMKILEQFKKYLEVGYYPLGTIYLLAVVPYFE